MVSDESGLLFREAGRSEELMVKELDQGFRPAASSDLRLIEQNLREHRVLDWNLESRTVNKSTRTLLVPVEVDDPLNVDVQKQ